MRKWTKLAMLMSMAFCILLQVCVAQTKLVKGKVTDAKDGTPILGATIKSDKTDFTTVTNPDGTFEFKAPSAATKLIISFVGFKTLELPITSDFSNIQLEEGASKALSEVVVVGFGTKIKKDLTGNIAKVKGADVQNMPVPNFTQALQGRAAGVFVESNNGKVGEGVKIRIRGSGSISASNEPLYVIDGVPINSSSNLAFSGNPSADINFNDIESFDILKDASAAAIYGSRAANGVVLITTKKGKQGKTNFQVNTQYGINKPTHLRGFLDAKQYVDLLREAATNSDNIDGVDPSDPDSWLTFAEGRLDRYSGWSDWRTSETNTNWEKLAFNDNARTSAIDISASGGTEKTKYYISLSYNNQDGILIGNKFKRLSGRINLEQIVASNFKIGMNLSISQTNAGRVPVDNEFSTPMQIVALSPVTPFRDKDGNVYNSPTTTYSNPYVDFTDGHWSSTIYRNLGNIYGQLNFTPSLFFRSEFGVDIQNQNDDQFYGFRTTYGTGTNGYGESDWNKVLNYNTNNYFNFSKNFSDVHDVEVVAGMAFQRYQNDWANVIGEQFPVEALQKLASAGLIKTGTSNQTYSSFLSYFARANYKFNNKYLLTLSGRVDGSSVFGKGNKYGVFPAASVGWIISEENFLRNSPTLSFLKLRGSWGLTGNADGFGNFAHLGLWEGVSYGGVAGLSPSQLANKNLRWEKSNQIDIGLDFGFFNNRLSGELDYYNRKTQDLIYDVPVPGNSGFTTQTVNIGAMQNKGFEIVLNSDNISGRNFKWSTNLNLSFNNNKIIKLDGSRDTLAGNDGRYLNSLIVGQSIGVFYGPKYAGVDKENGDALYYISDGKTTTNDYSEAGNFIVGNPNPKVTVGFGNTIKFKGFDLMFLFQGVFGNSIMNGAGGFMSSSFAWFDNQTADQLRRWQKPGDITDVPQLRLGYDNGTSASSRYIYKGDYIRLKNITLGYNLPSSVIKALKISSARFYVTGVNLLTFTKYDGWDPEVNTDYRAGNRNQGSDFYAAPQIKNISIGLNVGF
ncbi:MAG: TonB-dependent receptor [Chitinophagaceae bacterium]|nr:TonB-dependent receptor [Chitinophagaceae bacterium]